MCDDSTREAVRKKVDGAVISALEQGHNVQLVRRDNRSGFKAGAMVRSRRRPRAPARAAGLRLPATGGLPYALPCTRACRLGACMHACSVPRNRVHYCLLAGLSSQRLRLTKPAPD